MDTSNDKYNHVYSLLAACYCFTLISWIFSKYATMEYNNNVRNFYRRLFSDFSSEGREWYRVIYNKSESDGFDMFGSIRNFVSSDKFKMLSSTLVPYFMSKFMKVDSFNETSNNIDPNDILKDMDAFEKISKAKNVKLTELIKSSTDEKNVVDDTTDKKDTVEVGIGASYMVNQ